MPQEPRWPGSSDPQPDEWPESHTEQTDILPAVPPADAGNVESTSENTQHVPEESETSQEPAQSPAEASDESAAPAQGDAASASAASAASASAASLPSASGPDAEDTQHIAWPESDEEPTAYVAGGDAAAGTPDDAGANETTQYIAPVPTDDSPTPQYMTAAMPAQSAYSDAGDGAAAGGAGVAAAHDDAGDGAGAAGGGRSRGRARTPLLVAAAVLAVLGVAYVVDVFVTSGDVPRGTVVAGVEVGGMNRTAAEEKLRSQLEPRMTQPVQYRAGNVDNEFDPRDAGLRLNWSETLDEAGEQPLNPITRVTSFFTDRDVDVVTETEPNQLENAMVALQDTVDRKPVEGTITFDGATPKPVEPKHGQKLDADKAENIITRNWADGRRLNLPVTSTPVSISKDDVDAMVKDVAEPAVSGPVTVHGEGTDGSLEPEEIADALSFHAKDGKLEPKLDHKKLAGNIREDLASTITKGRDAQIVFKNGKPDVTPSRDGKHIKWNETLEPLMGVLRKTDKREIDARYEKQHPETTTADAKKLGVKEVIGEFTTEDFETDSGVNIRRVAEEVNGAIVKPGDTFSLNDYTGPRTKAQGYVEAGIIEDGQPGKAVGGGISQFATTMYNASYFAGMKDAGHQEHSYYISRYPEGREATVYQGANGENIIDLAFTNDQQTGVAIQTEWTPSSITVKLWGTKHYDVQSRTGDRSNFVKPPQKKGPRGDDCEPSEGTPGFTVTDTRVLRNLDTGDVSREPRTVRYNPQPKITCNDRNR